ncbi:hypothetical protein RF11_15665 [Thelohanellus kitauei]|uniref:Uncharacterized protein n=1 Tax=Thelohanellus kitauei TaxID=669202 RepID=A0A0C2JKF9_THEKT|nr:hypothetical protein RF11_15665 [Thelohanellus kitauei]
MDKYPEVYTAVVKFDEDMMEMVFDVVDDDFFWSMFTITDPWEEKGCNDLNNKELTEKFSDDEIESDALPHIISTLENMNWDDILSEYETSRNFFNSMKVFMELLKTELPGMIKNDESITGAEIEHFVKIIQKLIDISSCFEDSQEFLKTCICKPGMINDPNAHEKLCQEKTNE